MRPPCASSPRTPSISSLSTRIVSIDPHPRAEIDALCDEVLRAPFEDAADRVLERLTGEDLLVVDSSHRAFPGSDVTVFFMETLPALPAGLLYGVHDICLPRDYPPAWNARYYNEQYLLGAISAAERVGIPSGCPTRT